MLTDEQAIAASHPRSIYLEAHPGSGKTTVAARRFGVQRHDPASWRDPRAVMATSFTRSATRELRARVIRFWGSSALAFPHRIATIDTLVCDLVHYLLRCDTLTWPANHRVLDVRDTWSSVHKLDYTEAAPALRVHDGRVTITSYRSQERKNRVRHADFTMSVLAGVCTHDDVRDVLGRALTDPTIANAVGNRLASTMRAFIVDEVFDGNALDLNLIMLAARAGVEVTLIGDPWQALYGFRGARPELIPELIDRLALPTFPLSESFRWRTEPQSDLATELRERRPVVLPVGDLEHVDVVLSREWKPLWEAKAHFLPFAFSGAKGTLPEAAATLALSRLLELTFGVPAVDIADARALIGLGDDDDLGPELDDVLEVLGSDEEEAAKAAYAKLASAIAEHTDGVLPPVHWQYTKRLLWLRSRLRADRPLVPAMTAHQAKGREWPIVGVHLMESDEETLANGLDPQNERHRQLYVACTRARDRTVSV